MKQPNLYWGPCEEGYGQWKGKAGTWASPAPLSFSAVKIDGYLLGGRFPI